MSIKNTNGLTLLLLLGLCIAFSGSCGADKHEGKAGSHGNVQRYTCSMHPQVIQNEPGNCPVCGMELVPMKKSDQQARAGGCRESKPHSNSIKIDPAVVQNMGVRTERVKRGKLSRTVRTIGEVVVAEDLISVVNLRFSGWIEKLFVDQTGIPVRQGQPLFRIYSPELVSAQEEYLMAVRTSGEQSPLAQSAKRRLQLWELSESDIAGILQAGSPKRTVTIRSPRSGYVLHKNIVQGDQAQAGQDLFRIGKLSAIWIHVQVYESDAPWIEVGQPATMELSYQRGKLYEGKVSYIYPTLNEKTRTLTVRLEFVNPELSLKPGMFTTVRIKTRLQDGVLLVPTEAVIHSGERQIVFVTPELGHYELREIETGVSGDGHMTKVISGLHEGERVVTSGQFLLDSESQLQEAVQKMTDGNFQTNHDSEVSSNKHGHSLVQDQAMQESTDHNAHEMHENQSMKNGSKATPKREALPKQRGQKQRATEQAGRLEKPAKPAGNQTKPSMAPMNHEHHHMHMQAKP